MNPIKIAIYGTGGIAQWLVKNKKKNVNICVFIDDVSNEPAILVDEMKVPVITINQITEFEFDYVIIAFSDVAAGKRKLLDSGVDETKIVGYQINGGYGINNNPYQKMLDDTMQKELRQSIIIELFDVIPPRYYMCAMNMVNKNSIVEFDYVRERTLELLSDEIRRKKLEGEIAEFGVYKGHFAKKLNQLFPEKKLLLFDTFEGFDANDITRDASSNLFDCDKRFKDTNMHCVLRNMPHYESCIVEKGYFPETWRAEYNKYKFCLVSIDVDLYEPIMNGLKIFYPLLEKGGYILVHDYNNFVYRGTNRAVMEYCDANNISYVPIPDVCGSIIITK